MKMNAEPAKGSPRGPPSTVSAKNFFFPITWRAQSRTSSFVSMICVQNLDGKGVTRTLAQAGSAKAEAHALALVIAPGIRVADWEKFSAKNGKRVPHRSPGARDRWHPHLGAEKGSRPGPPAYLPRNRCFIQIKTLRLRAEGFDLDAEAKKKSLARQSLHAGCCSDLTAEFRSPYSHWSARRKAAG